MSFAFTLTRQRIYEYIVLFKGMNNGNSPSMRQMSVAFGLSTSVIYDHLNRLEAIGLIKRGRIGESRMIDVIGSTWTPPRVHGYSESDGHKLLEVVKG